MNITTAIAKLPARGNIGNNKGTVQTRFKEAFAASTKQEKVEIAKLSGKAQNSLYNIGKAGTIDAKTALALGSTLNVSPLWFTGADDEKKDFSEEILEEFVAANAPKDAKKAKRKYNRKTVSEVAPKTKPAEKAVETTDVAPVAVVKAVAPVRKLNLSLESASTLLSALYIRSEFDNSAKEKLQKIFAELV